MFVIACAVAMAMLLAFLLPSQRHFRVSGSLSEKDVRAITKELHRVRSRAVYVSLSRLQFGVFWRLASENFRLGLVSIEGDRTHAIAQCQDRSNWKITTYEFTNEGGLWSFTTVSFYESFTK